MSEKSYGIAIELGHKTLAGPKSNQRAVTGPELTNVESEAAPILSD